jgi:hypothetical protein
LITTEVTEKRRRINGVVIVGGIGNGELKLKEWWSNDINFGF